MDGIFSLSEAARTDFLRALVLQFSGCAYICLWQYDSCLTNRLFFLDGFYNINNQPSSSLGNISSVAERLFNQYQTLTFDVNHDCVPGLAFRNHHPYLELQQLDLLRLVSAEIQLQFIKEARIRVMAAPYSQTAVFMGCNKGEIELGFSNMSQVEIEAASLRGLFPEDFSRQPQLINYQNPHSSSSSSLRSLSTGSPEFSSLLLSNVQGTSMFHFPETSGVVVPTMQPMSAIEARPHQEAHIQRLGQVIPSHFLPPEGEHDAIIRALLHVISYSSTSHHQHQHQQNLTYTSSVAHPEATTAFKKYRSDHIGTNNITFNLRGQSMLKRSLAFSRSLNSLRMRERIQADACLTNIQLQHMISERRRREKLNEKFQALRALLPPRTKKDKGSIVTAAKETLGSLKAEIEKFNIRNQQLTTFLSAKEASTKVTSVSNSSSERLNVVVSNVPQSSSLEDRMVDLQVNVRGESSQVDIAIRSLEFFKRVQNVSLISMGANTHVTEGTTINQLTFRLRIIEGSAWDESAFQEAVRRLVLTCYMDT